MKFYDRINELAALHETEEIAKESAQFTTLVGRRRVGKTTLLRNAFNDSLTLYFFVTKKNERLLCEEFKDTVEQVLGEQIGRFERFADLFKVIMQISVRKHFTLIIDEFQEFKNINPSIFSDMQNIWDIYKDESKINLIACGSIYSMMKDIFEKGKEPLYGRTTSKMKLETFSIATIKDILRDNNPNYSNEDLLAFYLVTGGVAKYIEQLVNRKALTKKRIIDNVFSNGSYFLTEGKDVLIDEFGRDYGNYFSVLSLLASSKTSRSDIEGILDIDVGGYLERLEKDYDIIQRKKPYMAKEGSRNNKYFITDNFLNFWFRFVYKYRSAIEIGNYEYVKNIVERDYETYSGIVLEKYFRKMLAETKEFSDIQGYWDRKGENEIDIVAEDTYNKRLLICEVKRNADRISMPVLEKKASAIAEAYRKYDIEYKGFSMADM